MLVAGGRHAHDVIEVRVGEFEPRRDESDLRFGLRPGGAVREVAIEFRSGGAFITSLGLGPDGRVPEGKDARDAESLALVDRHATYRFFMGLKDPSGGFRVQRDGVEFVLLGTAHVSKRSADAVRAMLAHMTAPTAADAKRRQGMEPA